MSAYNYSIDIICLSEIYLDYSVALGDDNLEISGCNLVRSNHPLSYKNILPLRVFDIQHLQECINLELKIGDKLCKF